MVNGKEYSYSKISHFTDIEAWKIARRLRVEVFGIIRKLPFEGRFDLGSQMRKASVLSQQTLRRVMGDFIFKKISNSAE